MTADHVTAAIELADLRCGEKTRLADELRRDEAVPAPSSCLEPVGDDIEVRAPAIVHADKALRTCGGGWPAFAASDGGHGRARATPSSCASKASAVNL